MRDCDKAPDLVTKAVLAGFGGWCGHYGRGSFTGGAGDRSGRGVSSAKTAAARRFLSMNLKISATAAISSVVG